MASNVSMTYRFEKLVVDYSNTMESVSFRLGTYEIERKDKRKKIIFRFQFCHQAKLKMLNRQNKRKKLKSQSLFVVKLFL